MHAFGAKVPNGGARIDDHDLQERSASAAGVTSQSSTWFAAACAALLVFATRCSTSDTSLQWAPRHFA